MAFADEVYALVCQVPSGRVITYGTIARLLADPRKARQVGWAMATAPDEVPAHRVINARGDIPGGHASRRYRLHRKRLEAERVVFTQDGRVDLDRYLWLPAA